MSAPSALGTSSPPTSTRHPAAVWPDTLRVRIAGSPRTFEVRDVLRGMGLRWDPLSHAWHGSVPPTGRVQIERDLGLPVQLVRPLDSFPTDPEPPSPPASPSDPGLGPRRVRDGSRTRAEARILFSDEEQEGGGSPYDRFTVWDVTSGLPDDSREADERAAARNLRNLRARVKAARAVVAKNSDLAAILARESDRAAWFHARFEITLDQLRKGVIGLEEDDVGPILSLEGFPCSTTRSQG